MKIEGSELIPVAPGTLWPLLQDANALRRLLPGSEDVTAMTDNGYRLAVRQRIGPFDDRFVGTLYLSEKDANICLRAVANVESPNGMVRITGDIQLDEAGDHSTLLRYEGDVELGGRLASVSPRLVETTANAYVRRILEAIERETAPPQPYSMRNPSFAPPAESTDRQIAFHVPTWAVALLAAAAGALILRLLDNRRINGLDQAIPARETPSRTVRS